MSDWQTEVSDGVAVIVCPARVSMAVAASFRDAIGASEDDFVKVIAFLTFSGEACAEAPAE